MKKTVLFLFVRRCGGIPTGERSFIDHSSDIVIWNEVLSHLYVRSDHENMYCTPPRKLAHELSLGLTDLLVDTREVKAISSNAAT